MKLTEHICALFPYFDYTFPEGEYEITISKKTYSLICNKVILLKKNRFEINNELNEFYNSLKSNDQYFDERFPHPKENSILFLEDYFTIALKEYCNKTDLEKNIKSIIDSYFCIYIIIEHNYNGARENVNDYIIKIGGETGKDWLKKIPKLKSIYFSVIEEFYKYITILRSPYINVTDINYRNIGNMFTYFCWEDRTLISHEMIIPFDYWEPKSDHLSEKIQDFFDKKEDIPLEDLFMAKAKVYERLHNHSTAIIHTAIALEVVVPKFINEYLRSEGVDSASISDFDNKFGLSVRVKTILKIILETRFHDDINKVGTLIKFRNKIMHEGKTNEFFKNVNVEELIVSSESLILELKERMRQLED